MKNSNFSFKEFIKVPGRGLIAVGFSSGKTKVGEIVIIEGKEYQVKAVETTNLPYPKGERLVVGLTSEKYQEALISNTEIKERSDINVADRDLYSDAWMELYELRYGKIDPTEF
jgi:hypothetical protein